MMICDKPIFIDLFSGCGGLALGLMKAGWKGLFAIEKSPDAFRSLKYNLIDNRGKHTIPGFEWPDWLDVKPYDIADFIEEYETELREFNGRIELIAGGPPCQGFSFAGRRIEDDPRNGLYKFYLKMIEILGPRLILLENVRGITCAFRSSKSNSEEKKQELNKSYAEIICEELDKLGYHVQEYMLNAVEYGVPQFRQRYFILGIRKDLIHMASTPDLKKTLDELRSDFLARHGLPVDRYVTVSEAISDLGKNGKTIIDCHDEDSPSGFNEIVYRGPESFYQNLMHSNTGSKHLNSNRLVNHKDSTVERFQKIINTCEKGGYMSKRDRDRLGVNKSVLALLSPDKPSMTVTTLPDDLLHYNEPRILTVRELARLQSFPDWFEFKGKYTTGGPKRTDECPRYTQVGNAVPPLLAEIIGEALLLILKKITNCA